MNRIDRLLGYLLLFQSRGLMRAQDFAGQFEISERTVYRDIQALSEVGVPIVAMPGEGYRLMEGFYLPPITFAPAEARALYLAVSMLSGFTSPGATRTAALSALDKVRAVLPAATLRQVEALQAIINFYAFPSPTLDFDNKIFTTLQQAIYERHVVHLRYHAQHTNAVTEREVEPAEFVFLDKAWMLSGYCRLRQANRTFRLDRIDALQILNERFDPRDVNGSPPEPGSVIIKVRVDRSIVRWVRERQHFSMLAEEPLADPSGDVIMTYQPRSLDHLESWLLSWGGNVEVLAPASFRAQLAATAAQILAHYSK